MAAIYFHIPFCKRICAYCDFHRFADLSAMDAVLEAMHREMDETTDFLHEREIRTIYFGGGTPSLATPAELQKFIDHTARIYDTAKLEEITIEANPDDITPQFVAALKETDINRISLGIQTFDDRLLKFINRRHDGKQAEEAVRILQDAGYGNLTVDLIFGFREFGDDVVEKDLQQIVELEVQHVSAYHLTIEPSTRLGRMAARGEISAIEEERSEKLFRLIHNTLTNNGFEHYEVSNYAKAGFRSRHNSSYWLGTEYLGIGSGAHSFDGYQRRWCVQPVNKYIVKRDYEWEQLTERDRLNELVMTSLRRAEGLDLNIVAARFGERQAERLLRESRLLGGYGLEIDGDRIHIPPEHMLTSDAVIEILFDA